MPRPTPEESMQRWRTARDHNQDGLNVLRSLREKINAAINETEAQLVSALGKSQEGFNEEEAAAKEEGQEQGGGSSS